jgi:K+-transporting ATPase ATPase C chain
MFQLFRTATTLLLALTVLTGIIYPLAVTLIAQVLFPDQAAGSLIWVDDSGPKRLSADEQANRFDWSSPPASPSGTGRRLVGSELIGQPFADPKYFWGRLSATSPVPYNAAGSGGSNYGPLHPALKDAAERRIAALKPRGDDARKVPVDLVTASASGLDPQISPAAAEFQAPRIAAARNMKQFAVRALIRQHTAGRQLGVLGEPRVNVLRLNMALDQLDQAD